MTSWIASVRAPIVPDLDGDPTAASHPGHAVFETNCASMPRRQEVDEEPHGAALSDQPDLPQGSPRPGLFCRHSAARSQSDRRRRADRAWINLPNAASPHAAGPGRHLRRGFVARGARRWHDRPADDAGLSVLRHSGLQRCRRCSASRTRRRICTTVPRRLEDVLARHTIQTPGGARRSTACSRATERGDLLEFLRGIDEDTQTMQSDTDRALRRARSGCAGLASRAGRPSGRDSAWQVGIVTDDLEGGDETASPEVVTGKHGLRRMTSRSCSSPASDHHRARGAPPGR